MEGTLTDEKGRSIVLEMAAMYGQWHRIIIVSKSASERFVENPVSQKELREIMDKYKDYLIK